MPARRAVAQGAQSRQPSSSPGSTRGSAAMAGPSPAMAEAGRPAWFPCAPNRS